MRYLVISDWDSKFHPSRINFVEGLEAAQANVEKLKNGLPENKKAPNAFYGEAPEGEFYVEFVVVDPSTKTFTYDIAAKDAAQEAEKLAEVQINRRQAYQTEADPLFFEEQRGEVSAGTHAAKVAEIKLRFPK